MRLPPLNINIATACIGNVGHSWQMVAQTCSPLAHKGLLTAAKVMALACVRTMDRPDVIEAAKKEVTKRNGGPLHLPAAGQRNASAGYILGSILTAWQKNAAVRKRR